MPALDLTRTQPNGGLSIPSRKKEIFISSASPANANAGKEISSYALQVARSEAHLTLHDLRDEAQAAAASNQDLGAAATSKEATPKPKSSKDDPVLKYHVKLAHSWKQYQVR